MTETFSFSYQAFSNPAMLDAADAALLRAAQDAVVLAYAPYSEFCVGAALLLANGEIVKGGNQENAAYPAGICAERAALATASGLYPGVPLLAVAIAYQNRKQPAKNDLILSPCGICRQSLLEVSNRQDQDIRLLMSSPGNNGILVENLADMLPFAFSQQHLH